ncbi:MAG: hypothetical protein LBN98_03225 [Prevotellaceae bacterium]|nr:hypothetical protein [Prevotellaceae bacterium]
MTVTRGLLTVTRGLLTVTRGSLPVAEDSLPVADGSLPVAATVPVPPGSRRDASGAGRLRRMVYD